MIVVPDLKQTKQNKFLKIKKAATEMQIHIANQKTQGKLDFLLSVMSDSVPAMSDSPHLHRLQSQGRCSGICLHSLRGFCLVGPKKLVLHTAVRFYFSTFKSVIKNT